MFAVLPFMPRVAPAVPLPFTVTLTGLSVDSLGTYGQIGNHASIGYSASETPDEVIWSAEDPAGADKSGAPATYGTGANPTALAGATTVYLHVRVDTDWETRSFPARLPPVEAVDTDGFAWLVGTAIASYPIATNFTLNGNSGAYSVEGLPGWITNTSGTLTGTPPAPEVGTITITFTDSYGRIVTSVNPYATALFSDTVTATNSLNFDGRFERLVTSPAHLAAYAGNEGVEGLFSFSPTIAAQEPVILYPGEVAISQPDPGGSISLTHAPWAAGPAAMTIGYRVMLGSTALATSLPFSTAGRTPGEILDVFADVTPAGGSPVEVLIRSITLEENPLGPVLSGFDIDYVANAISAASDIAATVRIRRYSSNYVFTNQAQEVWDGTGATGSETNEFAGVAGLNEFEPVWTGGISGAQNVFIVARVGSGPLSNVIGGPAVITPAGATLTAPNIRGAGPVAGDGLSAGVAQLVVPLPAVDMSVDDLIILQFGVDCRADFIAGLTGTGPNGETLSVRRVDGATTDLVDNEEGGNSAASAGLLWCRNATARTGGNATINLTPGGFKSLEQLICVPIVRFNVKASGDPFGQVKRTFSVTAVSEATTAALTATSALSRIEAFFVNDSTLPPNDVPAGWFLRASGLIGPQAIKSISRNAETTASEVIAGAPVPLGPTPQRYVGITYEILPLGA